MQLYGPSFDTSDHVDQPDDIATALVQILDMVKAIDSTLGQVKENSQALRNELARVTDNVEELKTQVHVLKMTLESNTGNEICQSSSVESSVSPAIKKAVKAYNRTPNWIFLRESSEKLLDNYSAEYFQLQSINDYNSWGHLWQVGNKGHKELATLLLDSGMHVNKTDCEGDTMIHGAAEGGQVQLAEFLIERGADINLRGWRGLTPFNKAALGGKPEMVRWLADRGADVHSADDVGMTSLHFAAEHGHLEVAWLLVHMGLNTKAKDEQGLTPLDWARRHGHAAVVGYLSGHSH